MLAISVQRTFAPHRFETSADIGLERCQQMFADLIRKHGPQDVRGIELLTMEELQEIRRIWVVDKHELEDSLPLIYQSATGEPYPGAVLDDDLVLGASEMSQLKEICDGDRLHYELSRALLSLTRQQRNSARRPGFLKSSKRPSPSISTTTSRTPSSAPAPSPTSGTTVGKSERNPWQCALRTRNQATMPTPIKYDSRLHHQSLKPFVKHSARLAA